MAGSRSVTVASGRRGYIRYQYGDHFWIPEVQADWTRGIVSDTARVATPPGSVVGSTDFLLHQVGVAQKRGGTAYAGAALTAANYAAAVAYSPFPAGAQLVAVGDNAHLYTVAGSTTDKGATVATVDKPKLRIGGGAALLVIAASDGTSGPHKYDGSAAPAALAASAPAGKYLDIYKTRVAISGSSATPQRIFFSPTPDITGTWDTANSWIDGTFATTGLAALNNAILVFSEGHLERVIGSTPPPNTDLDLAPVAAVGTTDARSLVTTAGYCYFANSRGVWVTNGTDPVSMTKQAGVVNYWQSLFTNYDPSTWTLSAGMLREYLFVSLLDNARNLVACVMCDVNRRSFWRVLNFRPMMWSGSFRQADELYYADGSTNRVVATSQIFNPAAGNKNDANGNAVLPTIEFAPFGAGSGVKSYGFAHLNYDMRDAASDNPTLAVTLKQGVEADTTWTPPESPLGETTTMAKERVQVNTSAQSVTVALAQTNASAKTELYAVEVMNRPQSLTGEGVS